LPFIFCFFFIKCTVVKLQTGESNFEKKRCTKTVFFEWCCEARYQVWYCSLNDNPFGGGQGQPRLRDYVYQAKNRQRSFIFSSSKLLIMKEKKNAFPVIQPDAAGIDISSKEHFVAVNPERADAPIRCFGAFTEDLQAISAWLKECKVTTVAMEATGIYWVSLFLVLEEAGFEVILVNARHVKNVRGKKTDVSDADWIRQLHSCGLLSASFQPDKFTRTVRTYMRHRKNLLEMAATHSKNDAKGNGTDEY
jgi:hypothetical protein